MLFSFDLLKINGKCPFGMENHPWLHLDDLASAFPAKFIKIYSYVAFQVVLLTTYKRINAGCHITSSSKVIKR